MWPFAQKQNMNFEFWPIVRSKPLGKCYGRSISIFINNLECHLTTVDVYEDGAINCWGFVDLALLQNKLKSSWVVPGPKRKQKLSVFNFGFTGVSHGHWIQTPRSIAKEVQVIIRMLNPEMRDLLDMEGSDTEVRDGVRYAKILTDDRKIYRKNETVAGEIFADVVPILRVCGEVFDLTRLVIYADGLLQIGQETELIPIEDLPSLYENGQISNIAPAGSKIKMPGLGDFKTTTDFGFVSVHDRIAEVHNKLNVMNGKPSVISNCARLFREYEKNPSPEAKADLRNAYEEVPTHLRCYCGDMDTRDSAIRSVLYGKGNLT